MVFHAALTVKFDSYRKYQALAQGVRYAKGSAAARKSEGGSDAVCCTDVQSTHQGTAKRSPQNS